MTEALVGKNSLRIATIQFRTGYFSDLNTQETVLVNNLDDIIAFYNIQGETQIGNIRQIELSLFALTIVVLLLEGSFVFRPAVRKIQQTVAALSEEKEKSERLLLNILPESIANRLKEEESNIVDSFPQVTVLFADIVGFTQLSSTVSPRELVHLLNQLFSGFDELVERYQLEKIKTIGDAYMVVGGLPIQRPDHAEAIANMALAMLKFLRDFNLSG